MSKIAKAELERIDREIARLAAQREILLKVLGSDGEPDGSSAVVVHRRTRALRPTNPDNTNAILEAVAKHPGKTLAQIVKIVGDELGADDGRRTQIYNTGYGLVRRHKIQRENDGSLVVPVHG